MTGTTTTTRATCPDCYRDVPVNKDGSLRKHDCEPEPAPAAESAQEPPPVEEVPEAAPTPPEPPPVAMAGGRRLCAATRCDRVAVLGRLCGAHWAVRPDLRKVA